MLRSLPHIDFSNTPYVVIFVVSEVSFSWTFQYIFGNYLWVLPCMVKWISLAFLSFFKLTQFNIGCLNPFTCLIYFLNLCYFSKQMRLLSAALYWVHLCLNTPFTYWFLLLLFLLFRFIINILLLLLLIFFKGCSFMLFQKSQTLAILSCCFIVPTWVLLELYYLRYRWLLLLLLQVY